MCCPPADPCTLAWSGLTFAAPLAPWALLVCVIPVLLHLVLRQKARRQIFPALRLLSQVVPSGARAQRLRRILLLACRVALLGLLIGLLGRPGCSPDDPAAGPLPAGQTEPASVVFCLDDSASMGYRFQGRSRFDHARDHARRLLNETGRFVPGCQFAILTATDTEGVSWSPDPALAARRLDPLHVGTHNQGAAVLLQHARRILADARYDRQEIYLFTDLAAHAWRVSPPPLPPAIQAVWIVDVGHADSPNMALGWPDGPDGGSWLTDQPTDLPLRVSRVGPAAGDALIALHIDDQPRHRQAIEPPPEGTARALSLPAGTLDAGLYAATFDLQPADPLAIDNRRFAWIEVTDRPIVVIAPAGGEVAGLLSAMIAPDTLDPAHQRYGVHECGLDRLGDLPPPASHAMVLADPVRTSASTTSLLEAYVRGGGTVVLVPGPQTTPADLEALRPLLPAAVLGTVACSPPARVAATDLGHPFLRVFADTSIDSLNDRLVFRRLDLGPLATGTAVLAPFTDGTPALLERRLGKGRFVMLAFSPARDWSLFGSQAAPMITLLHGMLAALSPPIENIAALAAGTATHRWFTDLPDTTVRMVDALGSHSRTLPVTAGRVAPETDRPGLYRLETLAAPPRRLLHYSVNVAEAESDLARLADDEIVARFSPGLARVVRPAELHVPIAGRLQRDRNLLVPFALVLLALLLAETLFSNRFYGRSR